MTTTALETETVPSQAAAAARTKLNQAELRALRAELREEIREEIRAELRADLPGAEAQPRKNKKTKGRGRDARRGDAGAEPTTTTLATLAAQEAQEAREAGGSGPAAGPADGAGPVDGGGR